MDAGEVKFLLICRKSRSCVFVPCPFGSKSVVESMSNCDAGFVNPVCLLGHGVPIFH